MLKNGFFPAKRLEGKELNRQINYFSNKRESLLFLEAMLEPVVILNEQMQVVRANRALIEVFGVDNRAILGKRLGEIIDCEHQCLEPDGCGSSEYCSTCGALEAMMHTIVLDEECLTEFSTSTLTLDALDFEVKTTPYETDLGSFIILSLRDISENKRREFLERVFCHDLLNTVSGIQGMAKLMNSNEGNADIPRIVVNLADEIIDEIHSHQTLSAALKGDLVIEEEAVSSDDILQSVTDIFAGHVVAKGKKLKTLTFGETCVFNTDPVLLKRVLVNMVKNAFEASGVGSLISITVRRQEKQVVFEVHNNGYMERNVQLQVFRRSFSTKGTGRGFGTYSMRLFGEKYLKGKVGFVSEKDVGTTFSIAIPIESLE